jgi:hypothetical protein
VTNHVEVEAGHGLGNQVNALAVSSDGLIILAGGPPVLSLASKCGVNRNCAFLLRFRDTQKFPEGPEFLSLFFTPASNITALAYSPTGTFYGWDQSVGLVRIPTQAGHSFRRKSATRSDGTRPLIPR